MTQNDNLRPEGSQAIYPSLRGKAVIVSGGGSGIGAGLVEGFARQGARVGFVDIAEEASAQVVDSLGAAEHQPVFRQCDVTDTATYTGTLDTLMDEIGGCDILINNAASDDRHAVEDVSDAYWDERMAVNLKHQFFAARHAAARMEKQGGGVILNLGSISWHLGLEDLVIYQTAKAAIEGMTRALARELGPKNIRVNTIIPGNVKTPRQMKWYSPEGEQEIVDAQCLKGRLEPVDIAAMALFLSSDDARLCTAHNYWVDAGWR